MFCGTWKRKIDEKGRVAILKPFGEELDDKIIMCVFDNHARIFPRDFLRKISKSQLERTWIARVDRQGRLLIPKEISFFKKGEEVILLGRGDYLEIKRMNRKK